MINIFLLKNYISNYISKLTSVDFTASSSTTRIDSWKSNATSQGNIENFTKSGSNFAPPLVDHHSLPDIHINRH